MTKLSLRDLDVRGKRVLVRVDFNVPTELRGGKVRITDDTRIRESLPTINYLRDHGAKTILMSHFGRPKGKPVEKYSLRPIGDYLHSLIHQPVIFSHNAIGEVPEKIVEHMHNGDVALFENLRFQPGEEANDPGFAKALASLGDARVAVAGIAALPHRIAERLIAAISRPTIAYDKIFIASTGAKTARTQSTAMITNPTLARWCRTTARNSASAGLRDVRDAIRRAIGSIWTTVTMPVCVAALTILPTSTWRSPTTPEIGALTVA